MNDDLKNLKKLHAVALQEPSDSEFFKNRGSKEDYIRMLKHKMEKLNSESTMPTFKQYHEQKCWDGYKPDPNKKTKYSPSKGKTKRVNNCVKIKEDKYTPCDHCNQPAKCEAAGKCLKGEFNEGVIGRAKPTADRMRLDDNLKQRLLDHGMNMYQQHGAQPNDIITMLGKITRMDTNFSDTAKQAVFNYLGGDYINDLEAKLDAYDEDMYSEKNAKCTGPTKKASSTSKGKKYMKCVKDGSGYKRIHWGQKGAKASSGNSKRKKAFRARHKCSTAKSNTPRGQACKDW